MAASEQRFNRLFQLVRDFSVKTTGWQQALRYRTRPDEQHDLTLASLRTYGTRDEWMVIQAAAGLDSPEQPLTERDLILPTAVQLIALKQQAGFDGV